MDERGASDAGATQRDAWTPPSAAELEARGHVVVKRAFLVPPPGIGDATAAHAHASLSTQDGENADARARKRTNGGFNKRSKRGGGGGANAGRELKLCNDYVATGTCKYGDACKYAHDIDAWMRTKPSDLPGECIFSALESGCPYGVRCRYASTHDGGASSSALTNVETLPKPTSVDKENNALPREIQTKLRKKMYDFTRANTIAKFVQQPKEVRENGTNAATRVDTKSGDGEEESAAKRARAAAEDDNVTDVGAFTNMRAVEKKVIDFKNKLYLAPLTTVGNLPYRRVCKRLGADITCGEMAMVTNLIQGDSREWALMRRHPSEDVFGVQICGGFPDTVARCCQLLGDVVDCDFIDVNMGCPIDLVCGKGAGSMMLEKPKKMEQVIRAANIAALCPVTFKTRMSYTDKSRVAHALVPNVAEWGAAAVTLHGRTRAQRYRAEADWDYIAQTKLASSVPLIGNGDVYNQRDYYEHVETHGVDTCMLARGALIKPWLFTEIKERRDWDISSGERLDLLKQFASFGLEHWGSDDQGVENTRRYLLEWMSFLHRYVPVGLVERGPVTMNLRPPMYVGRNDLETLMASTKSEDWVKISSMLLGPPPEGFMFQPKHKSNAYGGTEGGQAFADWDAQG